MLETALRLLRDLVDPDDCWFDSSSTWCQAHGAGIERGGKCPHAEAKELLAQAGMETETR